MITIVCNADDFGYSRGVNHGIIDAHKYGVVNSATMMMNMPGTEHAILQAKENPSLHVGIHLVLTCGIPLSKGLKTIITDEGKFFRKPDVLFNSEMDLKEVEKEWRAQIDRFYSSGLKASHFDSIIMYI
ncbi:cellobiose phosphotransferase system YdjC-like protein [Halalkalibacter wakoensis JCM 9140]|uniref:Cellobiose phosphotransferase system YdjC-like protein n=1 Tax=Halalkalibacter wakoensis JCM 9140 TaxID=1236970 RepID=W4Q1L5_9BACI|nr:cellobiose phosphotransferase system YdjC-like protein [Halalkalibacter wakoensis JCM 9140]